MDINNNKFLVYLASSISIILWGLSYIWSNQLISLGVPITFFVFVRISLAAIILLSFNLLSGKFQRIHKEDLLCFLMLSFCEPLIYFLAETYGIKETGSPTISAMVIATVPIVSLVVGYLVFKESVTWLNALGVMLALGGLAFVLFCKFDVGVGDNFIFGILLLLLAVFAEVGHASFTKKLSSRYSPQNIAMYQFCFGAVYFLPFFLTDGIDTFDASLLGNWSLWRPMLCLAVLCSSIAFSLWAFSIKKLGVARSSVFLAMISIVTAVSATLLGQETLSLTQWLGVAVCAGGVILSQKGASRKKNA